VKLTRLLYRRLLGRHPDDAEQKLAQTLLGADPRQSVPAPASCWSYGYGSPAAFVPMPYFGEGSYRMGKAFPDPEFDYLMLNSQGGHPGRDGSRAVIRRWTAPDSMTVTIRGVFSHGSPQGDGVRGRLVSSRQGQVGDWKAHGVSVVTALDRVQGRSGGMLGFRGRSDREPRL
jgi:hypothetical protein